MRQAGFSPRFGSILRPARAALITVLLAASPVRAQAPAGGAPGYYFIPIIGPIGTGYADAFDKAVRATQNLKSQYAVIYLNTPGGDVGEMTRIIKTIGDHPDIHFVGVVRKAGSAGAVIAMSCRTVLITPTATIGGTVPYTYDKKGIPANVDAKFRAFFDADVRSAVEHAGQDVLLARGMAEPDLVLAAAPRANQRAEIVDATESRDLLQKRAGAKIIKEKGKILVLTGSEAVDVGLARGLVTEPKTGFPIPEDEIASLLGLSTWRRTGNHEPTMRKVRVAVVEEEFTTGKPGQYLKELDAAIEKLRRDERDGASVITAARDVVSRNNTTANRARLQVMENQLRDIGTDLKKLQDEKARVMDIRRDLLVKAGAAR